jgi:hypothetical protein
MALFSVIAFMSLSQDTQRKTVELGFDLVDIAIRPIKSPHQVRTVYYAD